MLRNLEGLWLFMYGRDVLTLVGRGGFYWLTSLIFALSFFLKFCDLKQEP